MKFNRIQLILMLAPLLIFLFLIPKQSDAASKMPEGSSIANVSITGKTTGEAKTTIDNALATWMSGEDLLVKSDFETVYIPRNAFIFDVQATIDEFEKKTKRKLINFFIKPKNVKVPLFVSINKEDETVQTLLQLDYVDIDNVINSLELVAKQLENSDVDMTYLNDPPLEKTAEVIVEIPNISNVVTDSVIEKLNNEVIKSNDYFSFIETIDISDSLSNSTDELSFLASSLFQLLLQTDITIVERHTHINLPDYLEPGLDVFVQVKENKDFLVVNQSNFSYQIVVEQNNDDLILSLFSMGNKINADYEVKNKDEIEYKTLYRYNDELAEGDSEILQKGANGLKVELFRNLYENNQLINSEIISKDIYMPTPEIILTSINNKKAESDDGDIDDTDKYDIDDERVDTVDRMIENLSWIYLLQEMQIEQEEQMQNGSLIKDQIDHVNSAYEQLQANLSFYRESLNEGEQDAIESLGEQVDENLHQLENEIKKLLQLYTDEAEMSLLLGGDD